MTDSFYTTLHSANVPIKAWVNGVLFEERAQLQLKNIASLPFIYKWVAAMPDVHVGIGATVGSVVPTVGAIIPAAVGVDVGCGMLAARTTLTANDLPDDLKHIRTAIEQAVPHGRTDNGGRNDKGAWQTDLPAEVQAAWMGLEGGYKRILSKHPKIDHHRAAGHLCTLGTGNHHLELCLDENNDVWVMLHTGSRGIGNKIGTYFIELAKEDMRRFFINLPDKDLAYLPEGTEHFDDYFAAILWAQNYAKESRQLMLGATVAAMKKTRLPPFGLKEEAVNCHHNYAAIESHYGQNVYVTRKGAVRARKGDMGIIPGSMATGSYIVRGKGNPESFNSCSHGAGRRMSRTEARKRISLEDHIEATKDVECRKDADVIDESPAAYKSLVDVMAAQSDLVEIVHSLRQVICIKG